MTPEPVTAQIISDSAIALSTDRLSAARAHSPVRQNWILGPIQDALLIIVAPLITLALALAAIHYWGAAEGATIVLLVHVVFTVAHHLPTFIRIYGDVELFKRFNWRFVFAPLIAFGFALGVCAYLNLKGYPLDRFLYLYIILTLWDPWHFMRQHYGFMRIYDRCNAAPRSLSARMDLLLAASWFAYIMLASGDWLLNLLEDVYTRVHWSMLLALTGDGLSFFTGLLRNLALGMSAVYLGYLVWCWRKGYFVSTAKVLLCAVTFGVMYLTYTPNALIQSLAPGWSFNVGFAVIGLVHMTQYLAIVWRYNRGLASRAGRARSGVFRWLHSRGAWWAAGAYAVLCLIYGDVVTTVHNNEWLMALLLALGFTSTMMHYYFDGFIWKVRHQQNQEALEGNVTLPEGRGMPRPYREGDDTVSWWSSFKHASAVSVFTRQLLYFGVPMIVLTVAAMALWSQPADDASAGAYVDHMYKAQSLNAQGFGGLAEQEARMAYAAMQAQLPLARKRTELQPSGAREAELAFLIYNESLYQNVVMPALEGQRSSQAQFLQHREHVHEAVKLLTHAVERGDALGHAGRLQFTVEDAKAVLASWRKQVG